MWDLRTLHLPADHARPGISDRVVVRRVSAAVPLMMVYDLSEEV